MLFIIIVFYLRYIIIFVTIFNLLLLYFIDSLFFFLLQAYRAKLSMLSTVSKIRGRWSLWDILRQRAFWEIACCTMAMNLEFESGFGMFKTNETQWVFFTALKMSKYQFWVLLQLQVLRCLKWEEALKQVAQAKDCMDVRVKRTFIDPLQSLQTQRAEGNCGQSEWSKWFDILWFCW